MMRSHTRTLITVGPASQLQVSSHELQAPLLALGRGLQRVA